MRTDFRVKYNLLVRDIYGPTIPLGVIWVPYLLLGTLLLKYIRESHIFSHCTSGKAFIHHITLSYIILHYRSSRSIIYYLVYIFSHCTSEHYFRLWAQTASKYNNIKSSFSSFTTVSDTTRAYSTNSLRYDSIFQKKIQNKLF